MEKLVPKLRFPEFEGNWEKKNGNLIFENISNKNHNSDLPILAITQEFGAIPRDLIDYKVSVTDKSIDSYKVVQIGDFIISLRSFQGGIEYSNYKGICSPAYIILRPYVEINNLFFKIYFKTNKYIKELQKNLEGIRDGKMISYKYFSDIKLPDPSFEEQTKIATFLTAVDDKLQALKQKKTLLEQYKKGVMQKIFSQELRFKDDTSTSLSAGNGNEYPDWEEKKLGEISQLITKGTTPKKFINEGIKFIKIESFEGDKINGDKCLFIDENTHNKELKRSILKENDLLFAIAGSIGKVNFVTNEILPANTNQALSIIRLKEEECKNYIYQILKSDRMKRYITDSISVGAQPNLNLEQMNNFTFFYPTIVEQTKIANFLSAIDDKINHCQSQIEKMEVWKKGLLQQMFV